MLAGCMIGRTPSKATLKQAIQPYIDADEVAGAVACVVDGERVRQRMAFGLRTAKPNVRCVQTRCSGSPQ